MQWLAEPFLMEQNRGAVTWQDKVWMACSNVEIIWHRDFTDADEPSPVLEADSVGGHSHLVTVLLEQVLSGLRRRKSRLVRKWNMLGENRTPHLKTLTKKTVFISACCLHFTFSSHRLLCRQVSTMAAPLWDFCSQTHPGRQKTPPFLQESTHNLLLKNLRHPNYDVME